MDNKEKIDDLVQRLNSIYNELEILRDNIDPDIQDGVNNARGLISNTIYTLGYQKDLIIFKSRGDLEAVNKTKEKIELLFAN